MLTLKLITEQTERVIAGLEKKHFADARQAIEEVIAVDKARRGAQQSSTRTSLQPRSLQPK